MTDLRPDAVSSRQRPAGTRIGRTISLTAASTIPSVVRARQRPSSSPSDGESTVRLISDAWQAVSAALTVDDALNTVAELTRRAVSASWADVELAPADGEVEAGTVVVPIVGGARQTLGHLRIGGELVADGLTGDQDAMVHAMAQMAGTMIELGTSRRNLQAVLDHSPAAIFLKDGDLRYVVANRRAAEMMGLTAATDLIGRRDDELLPTGDAKRLMDSDRSILAGDGDVDVEVDAHWPQASRRVHVHAFGVRDANGSPIGVGGVISDITAHRGAVAALAASESRYRLLFENALDAILVADDAGRFVEANPAACTLLGWSRAGILERTVGDIVVDRSSAEDGHPTWDRFRFGEQPAGGETVTKGDARLRCADGTVREADVTTAPNVAPGLHLMVLRDTTERRHQERITRQRHSILSALVALPARASVEEQADAACREMAECGDFSNIAIFAPEPPDRLAMLGLAIGADSRPVDLPDIVEGRRARRILDMARSGPWVDDWTSPSGLSPGTLADDLQIQSVAWAPLRADGRVIALLCVGGAMPAADMAPTMPWIVELAAVLEGSALGASLRDRASIVASRDRIRAVIAEGAYRAVFQPIVDLASGQHLGYEALTRFADGAAPDAVFAEAGAAGLRMELEIATAETALRSAGPLPANRFININVSPELVLAREPLRTMLREWGFGVVLEVTEHTPVADYGAVRAAIADIGEHIQLAVDDAGAGFASLRHILELRPAMVKLDRSLISGVDQDPARQALIAGMVHFAARLEFILLAEGVETEAERVALLELGVTRAQGYLFGRPMPAAALAGISS